MNPSTRNQHAAAVRFFLSKTLGKDWAKDKIPNSRTEVPFECVVREPKW
jgi:hypothetical protein